MRGSQLVLLLALAALSCATPENKWSSTMRRQLPKAPTGVKSIKTPNNVTIRYKEPGTEGVCETTPGVKSYSGYVDLSPESHTFFWFFESRRDPENDPVTLWLNGGPGSDSLIGLFEELGPCHITPEYESIINQYSWNEVTNLLFLSQPLGVGFSYSETEAGSLNPITGVTENASFAGVQGRYPVIDATIIDTTDIAARATWEVLQGFLGGLSQLDSEVKSKEFNLWTESYGGHYGPAFFNHFYEQNSKIANGEVSGVQLNFNSLGIINGIIDAAIQANYYPEFAVNNTYGIKALNDTVYNYMKFANTMPNGCQDQVSLCKLTNRTSLADYAICTEAANMCRDNVEGPYYQFGGRGVYDIRHPYNDPTPPSYFVDYLNKDSVMDAIGVDINYTESSSDVYYAFQQTGDFVWPNFIEDLEEILRLPVRVSLIYGDADYICNWFGGQAISLAVNYTHASQFRAAGYTPMTVDGVEYGETREYGNFSFTRVYQAGHEVPYYQPIAALQLFNRTLFGWDIAAGTTQIWPDYTTNGTAQATHTQSFVPLSTASSTIVD
ncbi:peptidase S10, serine carboxypeptidase [Aspergillus costaricaensis CBS 115574]|uniref:Peptidase S10, serine carboxypeptidase n=1 Tax=Aspergillus costaricaensis CBS 115574 TaxID=1448317 RepID=A0ACD1IL16_9EURO|nr:peptidase S10, serine carboxypeptidase [Aspergillus costaricaensis CBS 115574]RAK91333.1 peptidase S10, serine carboxypeptidase [Aspergillus costaricaensis CBS 115574]